MYAGQIRHVLRQAPTGRLVPVEDVNMRPFFGKPLGGRGADRAGAAGDQDALAMQSLHGDLPSRNDFIDGSFLVSCGHREITGKQRIHARHHRYPP